MEACLNHNITEDLDQDIDIIDPTLTSLAPPRLNHSKAKEKFDQLMCERRVEKTEACKNNHVRKVHLPYLDVSL